MPLHLANLTPCYEIIRSFQINCIVDLRLEGTKEANYCDNEQKLRTFLSQCKVFRLGFFKEFVEYNAAHYARKKWNYNKAIQEQNTACALQRIETGIDKGYKILILEDEEKLAQSLRFKLIGRFLHDKGYVIFHFDKNKQSVTHKDFLALEESKKAKKLEAQHLGRKGEDIAAKYLTERGFVIIDRNWNLHKGCEIDIVARKHDTFHFVEVKTRRDDSLAAPTEAINNQKIKNIQKAAFQYRIQHGWFKSPFCFDSIGIIYHSSNDYSITFYENIPVMTFRR